MRRLLFPIRLILQLLDLLIDIFMKVECLVSAIWFIFLTICLIVSIINQMWFQTGVFIGVVIVSIIMLLLTAELKVAVELLLEKVK